MKFALTIDPKDQAAASYIGEVRAELVKQILLAEKRGIKRSDIAKKMDVDRSQVTRILNGEANLTLRSVALLSWAIGMVPKEFELQSIAKLNEPKVRVETDWGAHEYEVLKELVEMTMCAQPRSFEPTVFDASEFNVSNAFYSNDQVANFS